LDRASEGALQKGGEHSGETEPDGGPVTIGDVSRRLGAPGGSIYHWFPSREELLVRLWLRSVRRFHEAYLAAGDGEDAEQALVDMALRVASFTAQHQRRPCP